MDYREIICKKFEERKRQNSRYSLRSFARDLKISPSRLSDVLAGKGNLAPGRAVQIAELLKLNPVLSQDFVDMVQSVGQGPLTVRAAASNRVGTRRDRKNVRDLSEEQLAILSDWRTLAVWNFMTLPGFDGSRQSIAQEFNLNMIEVEEILRRLHRLEMIFVNGKTGVLGPTQAYTGGQFPSEVVRDFHRQMSTLGRASIDRQAFEDRHLESAIMTLDRSKLPEIQQKIANFCRSLVKDYGDSPTNNCVYGLSLQMFKMAPLN